MVLISLWGQIFVTGGSGKSKLHSVAYTDGDNSGGSYLVNRQPGIMVQFNIISQSVAAIKSACSSCDITD